MFRSGPTAGPRPHPHRFPRFTPTAYMRGGPSRLQPAHLVAAVAELGSLRYMQLERLSVDIVAPV